MHGMDACSGHVFEEGLVALPLDDVVYNSEPATRILAYHTEIAGVQVRGSLILHFGRT